MKHDICWFCHQDGHGQIRRRHVTVTQVDFVLNLKLLVEITGREAILPIKSVRMSRHLKSDLEHII